MDSILLSLQTIGPVFLIIALGAAIRRFGLLDTDLSGKLTRLVFYIFLPALILRALILADFSSFLSFRILFVIWGTLFIGGAAAWLIAWTCGVKPRSRGFFTAGSAWGNVAIIGYALGEAIYGEEGLARATIYSALILPLNTPLGYALMGNWRNGGLGRRLLFNPLILTIILGVVIKLLSVPVPTFALNILGILGRASLPLALIAIGGSLEYSKDPDGWTEPAGAALIKLILMPTMAFFASRIAGLSPAWTGTVIIGFGTPTAVSFFVVSKSLGYDGARGAAIVTLTTVASALTTGLIGVLLYRFNWA